MSSDPITPEQLKAAVSVLRSVIKYQFDCVQENREASAHCIRRSCEDVLEILTVGLDDVELDR